VLPNVILRKAGLLELRGLGIGSAQVRATSSGGSAFIYVLDAANRDALIERAAGLFKDAEGVDLVIPPADSRSMEWAIRRRTRACPTWSSARSADTRSRKCPSASWP